jgi:hypothetical protein
MSNLICEMCYKNFSNSIRSDEVLLPIIVNDKKNKVSSLYKNIVLL